MGKKRILAILGAVSICLSSGCAFQYLLEGTEQGVLFQGFDSLARPGDEITLSAKLLAGSYLRPMPNYLVTFYQGDSPVGSSRTDEKGVAEIPFVPENEGDYLFEARLDPEETMLENPPRASFLVCCRDKDTPFVIVDLDETIVATGFQTVIIGNPEPMAGSVEVMNRLAETMTPVYLTHRPDFFGPSTKQWLRENKYPEGPLLLSEIRSFFQGSGKFKSGKISDMEELFPNLEIGIGDKVSDALTYIEHGMKAYLVVQVQSGRDKKYYSDLAKKIESVPPQVTVVSSWDEISASLFENKEPSREALLREIGDLRKEAPLHLPL